METVTHGLTGRNRTSENQFNSGIGTKGTFVVGTGSFDSNGLQQSHVYMAQGLEKKDKLFSILGRRGFHNGYAISNIKAPQWSH